MLVTALDQRRSRASRLPRRTAVPADRDALHRAPGTTTQPPWYFLGVIAGVLAAVLARAAVAAAALARCVARARCEACGCRSAWALLVLVFFSASPGKRDMYILPMLPMVARGRRALPATRSPQSKRVPRAACSRSSSRSASCFVGRGPGRAAGRAALRSEAESRTRPRAAADALWWLLASLRRARCSRRCAWLAARRVERGGRRRCRCWWSCLFSGTAVLLDAENSARAVMARARDAGRRRDASAWSAGRNRTCCRRRARRSNSASSARRSKRNCARASLDGGGAGIAAPVRARRRRWTTACCASARRRSAPPIAGRGGCWMPTAIAPACLPAVRRADARASRSYLSLA